eukprot:SAG11_NODE_3748_length_2251_cov_2.615706_1_plen_316_part_00
MVTMQNTMNVTMSVRARSPTKRRSHQRLPSEPFEFDEPECSPHPNTRCGEAPTVAPTDRTTSGGSNGSYFSDPFAPVSSGGRSSVATAAVEKAATAEVAAVLDETDDASHLSPFKRLGGAESARPDALLRALANQPLSSVVSGGSYSLRGGALLSAPTATIATEAEDLTDLRASATSVSTLCGAPATTPRGLIQADGRIGPTELGSDGGASYCAGATLLLCVLHACAAAAQLSHALCAGELELGSSGGVLGHSTIAVSVESVAVAPALALTTWGEEPWALGTVIISAQLAALVLAFRYGAQGVLHRNQSMRPARV